MPNSISLTGNVSQDPELRFTPGGQAVCTFSVADNYKRKEKDDIVVFVQVTCWNQLAENVAESIRKGTRVTVTGRFQFDQWEDKDSGAKRSKLSMTAFTVAPDLSWATAEVTKNEKKEGNEPWVPSDDDSPFPS
jgi:single-strand DNA-binding protein